MQIQWIEKKFEALTPYQLYTILQLRNEVFVVEQNCVFQDADDKDQDCFHLMGFWNNKLVAYTRLVPPGHIYAETSIGRVVTSPSVRGSGAGRELMKQSIDRCYQLFGNGPIRIGAQFYLKTFYESFGFQQVSAIYLEDGIEHIYMLLNPA
ncbi:MAG TPA: GNAT family N-acetyltransferase [Flavisolibacter sp.]|jgi:ElaA protein|nr:GNAT family N-acetyltransferase [Flavisolibacter sp.]